MRRWIAAAVVLPFLAGCSGFFTPVDNSGGGTGGGTGGGGTTTGSNSVYVGNIVTSSLNGFNIGSGTLTTITNLPVKLSAIPASMVVTPANNFLYVSTLSGIYLYVINANGTLTVGSNPIPAGSMRPRWPSHRTATG